MIPDRLCEMGRFGRKTGAGYYRYDESGKKLRDPDVETLVVAASAEKGILRRPYSVAEIQLRALAAIVNEAALVVEEGIALRPGDVDVALVNGYGFPRWRGGPVQWATLQNPGGLAEACSRFAEMSGPSRKRGNLRLIGVGEGDKE